MPLQCKWSFAAAALVMALAACDDNGGLAGSSPSRSTAPPGKSASPRRTEDPRVTAIAVYRGMWTAYDKARTNPRSDDPTLSRYATGAALWTLLAQLQAAKNLGLRGTGSVTTSPVVTKVTPVRRPTRISIRDCLDTSKSKLVPVASGSPYRDTPGGRRLCEADVQQQIDGSWKVLTFSIRPVGSCG